MTRTSWTNRERLRPRGTLLTTLLLVGLLAPRIGMAAEQDQGLADLSLEQLANLPVTSVSKKPEPLADAAASVYVITNDAIRRSGARTLPEALRLAPNLEVAQMNADSWAISARGATATSADKLLVLIDGRIIYSPLLNGTFWDAQNVMLEDIDHIEVISGPGGTLWGTNAVNGVINIITKKSQDSQGTLASAGGGRYGADGAARYGAGLSDGGSYRVYALVKDSYATDNSTGMPLQDGLNTAQAGFRSDWAASDHQFTLQGDAYGTNEDQTLPGGRARASGLNLLSHWDDKLESGSDLSLLAYYDRTNRYAPTDYGEKLDIADVELQQALPEAYSQEFIWGASYRYAKDDIQDLPGSSLAFIPADVNLGWSSLFAQDEARLAPDWRLIGGARLEHNPYTGNEFLPNLRLAWNPSQDSLLWSAVSRAVRSPSRLETQGYVPEQPPFELVGDPNYQSETARVYELGYRGEPAENLSFSVTGYHYNYFHLRTENLESTTPLLLTFANDMTGSETGVEMWGAYQPTEAWRISLGFSSLREGRTISGTALPTSPSTEGDDAPSQWMLRSSYLLTDGQEIDLSLRRVAALPDPAVPSYMTGNLRYAWSLGPHFDCSILAQNIFGPAHIEFANPTPASATQFGRGLYVKLEWRP